MSLDYPPTPHQTQIASRRLAENVAALHDLHLNMTPIQAEIVAYVNFFSQERFDDNSEFIDDLTLKMNQSHKIFNFTCEEYERIGSSEADMIIQQTREATREIRKNLEINPPQAEIKRENILSSWKEGIEPDLKMFEDHSKTVKEDLERQHNEAEETITHAQTVLDETHEMEMKNLHARFKQSHQQNADYVREFGIQSKKLHELREREEKEQELVGATGDWMPAM